MITCPSCGSEVAPGKKFCKTCGAALPIAGPAAPAPAVLPAAFICPACSYQAPVPTKFCLKCGCRLSDAPLPPAAAPGAGYATPSKAVPASEGRPGRSVQAIVLVSLCAFLVLGAAFFLAYRRTSGQSRSSPTQPQASALTGEWRITDTIEETSYLPFRGLQLGYRVFFQQDGRHFKGKGEKRWENGTDIPSTAQSPIYIEGILDGSTLNATFVEHGTRRTTHGSFRWTLSAGGKRMDGTFVHTAANARGTSFGNKIE